MANITNIDPTKSISLAPAIINNNFANVNNELAAIANLLNVANDSLALNKKIAAPANGVEASAIILTAISGLLINAMPNGVSTVFSVSNLGEIVALKLALDQAQLSTFGGAEFYGNVVIKEKITIEKTIDLTAVGSAILLKHNIVAITPANIGAAATNPIDISKLNEILFDAANGGTQLVAPGSDATINIDTSNIQKGQIFTMRLFIKNTTNKLRLLNGDVTAPLFAVINYTNGYQEIAYTVFPEFDDAIAGHAWIKVQWVEVTPSNFRFVVLDSNNMANI